MGLSNFKFVNKIFSENIKNRNNGNMSVYNGCTIQSYSTDIAYFNNKINLCIINNDYYSSTTAHHKSLIRTCCPYKNVFYLKFNKNIELFFMNKGDEIDLLNEFIECNIKELERSLSLFFEFKKNKSNMKYEILSLMENVVGFINYVSKNLNININKTNFLNRIENIYLILKHNTRPSRFELFIRKDANKQLKVLKDHFNKILLKIKLKIESSNGNFKYFDDNVKWEDNSDILNEIKKSNVYNALSILINRYEQVIWWDLSKLYIILMKECFIFKHPESLNNKKIYSYSKFKLFPNYFDFNGYIPIRNNKVYNSRFSFMIKDDKIEYLKNLLKKTDDTFINFNDYFFHRNDIENILNKRKVWKIIY